jgi:hypothetical protein
LQWILLGLGIVCGFLGLFEVLLVDSTEVGFRCISHSCAFFGLLGRLLGSSCTLASGFIKLSKSGFCQFCQVALLHIELMGSCVGLDVYLCLDRVRSHTHVHEKGFMHHTMPDGET